jgi:hypothetical protein
MGGEMSPFYDDDKALAMEEGQERMRNLMV